MLNRSQLEQHERENLAPYAMKSADSRGRFYPEEEHPLRTAFQRDKDRIIHSKSFRRLEYKTQVFLNHEGDHYRTRLTHTIEVSQISRTVARTLGLNEDLTEAVALAHDLGHTPFGHVGERVLDECLRDEGGFEHNAQTLRLVESLENRYPEFPGLNLTHEARRALTKQRPPYAGSTLGREDTSGAPLLEAQVVNLADEIAYSSHDIDDGLRSGILNWEMLGEGLPIWKRITEHLCASHADMNPRFRHYQGVRHLIDFLTNDLIQTSSQRIAEEGIGSPEDVRARGDRIVRFSDATATETDALGRFLHKNLYGNPGVRRKTDRARDVLEKLFHVYRKTPSLLPSTDSRVNEEDSVPRRIADYLAGMTDRYALDVYSTHFGAVPEDLK